MRTEYALNNQWLYTKQYIEGYQNWSCDESAFAEVRLPHTTQELPYQYFDEASYQMVSCYRKHFEADESWKDKTVYLQFGAVSSYAQVYINGQFAGEHKGGYTAFSFAIQNYLSYEQQNTITVIVDSTEREEIPPFGKVIDYLVYGGLYREVSLLVVANSHITDVFAKTLRILETKKQLQLDIQLAQTNERQHISYVLHDQAGNEVFRSQQVAVSASSLSLMDELADIALWDIEHPNLYHVTVYLEEQGTVVDTYTIRIGFRECIFKEDGFYLNGKQIKLMGLNRHQAYPYVGYAMVKSGQEKDAELLKYELGVNLVRTSHYPQSQHFINRCDELGLLVFTEIPGWQHIGPEGEWWDITCQHTKEMVLQYRNHPSIIIWGVRINESPDCDALYKKTNEICHSLDDTRQTGGVRCIKDSNLLEDVYTYNDFIHRGNNAALDEVARVTGGVKAPYLVTEYNGHMFPTKRFDHEKRRLEHALRHMRVLHAMHKDPCISGSVGWCMNDYNTHKDFGSGDRICYHGVLDMFRQPKLASYAYASQQDQFPVMELSSTMDIGEHDACEIKDVYVFTNLERIDVYKNKEFIQSFYPNKEEFPYLPHPPVVIDDMIGDQILRHESYEPNVAAKIKELALAISKYGQNTLPAVYEQKMLEVAKDHGISRDEVQAMYSKYVGNWGGTVITYEFQGIQDGKVVKTIQKGPVTSFHYAIKADRTTLIEEDTYDMSRVVIEAIDQFGNILPFYHEAVQVSVQGDIALVGSCLLSFAGGSCGLYVKSAGKSGTGVLRIESERLGMQEVSFEVKKKKC